MLLNTFCKKCAGMIADGEHVLFQGYFTASLYIWMSALWKEKVSIIQRFHVLTTYVVGLQNTTILFSGYP